MKTPPEVWSPAHHAAQKLAAPIYRFFALEAASGLLLIVAIALAVVIANSPWAEHYHALWHAPVGIEVASWSIERPLHFWVNEGVMTIFFLVVGLEIRRELHEGELATPRRAALPLAAALGGVVLPIVVFTVLNIGRAGAGGWAIPMATDIAFALGVLSLLGSRVPPAWRILLLGLAVIDDIIAIVVIAAFFSGGISLPGLAVAGGGLGLCLLIRGAGARIAAAYVIPGAIVWWGLYAAGVHPTLAGVMLGLLVPARPWSGREDTSPAEHLIHRLHPWVSFVVMPVFAFANAGVSLVGADLSGDGAWLFAGIVAGLVVGKTCGIAGAALLAARLGIAERSPELSTRGLVLIGAVGGIGFTMSLFVAQLALTGTLLETAKFAVLTGSALAMLLGLGYGWLIKTPQSPAASQTPSYSTAKPRTS